MNYKYIKDFNTRCEEHPDHQSGMVTNAMIQQRLHEEIDELRDYIEQAEKQEPVSRKYSIEKHGEGYAIYCGRDWQHHGMNIGHLTEVTPATIKLIEDALNQKTEQAEKQEPVANRSDCGHKEFMPLCQMCQAMGAQAHSYTAPPMTPEHLPQYIATDGKPMESGGGGVCSRPRKEWVCKKCGEQDVD
jgi:hypothetical protein